MHDIPFQDIRVVDLPPAEQVKAISKGEIDAMIVWQPWATKAKENWETMPSVGQLEWDMAITGCCSAQPETIKKRSSAIRRVLAALASAEEFIKNHKDEAEQIMARHMGRAIPAGRHTAFGLN